jgi:hypothetical protein
MSPGWTVSGLDTGSMAAGVVRYEPVSSRNSLLAGNLQGISSILASACDFTLYLTSKINSL